MKTIEEPAREVPVVREVDVVVAGGGPAGVAAAIAAGRNGAKTLLVERYGCLGGMMTGSNVTWYLGFGDGKKQVVRGLAEETVVRLAAAGGLVSKRNRSGDCNSDAEFVKWLSVVMLEEAGVEMLLHSWVASAVTERNACRGIIVENKSGRQAVLAKVTVDATADGDVCLFAGAEMNTDDHDITLVCQLEGVDREKATEFQKKDAAAYARLMDALKEEGGEIPSRGGAKFAGRSAVNVNDLTHIENEARKRMFTGLVFLRENVPGYENARLSWTAAQLGVRESRKLVGEYTIAEEDILNSKQCDDTIGRCGAQMTGYQLYDVSGLDYDIPYRCLVPANVGDLLASGRCISATHEAMNTLRLIAPCMLTAEAAGTAAALAVKQGVPPRDMDVSELQAKLRVQGANLG